VTHPKGKARERWFVQQVEQNGVLEARYAEHNGAGRDVDIRADLLRIAEVKDRQQLNVHKTLAHTQSHHPNYPPAVLWHRVSKPSGAKRSIPDGPAIIALPYRDWIDLVEIAAAASRHLDQASPDEYARMAELEYAVLRAYGRYPDARGAWR